MTSDRYNAREAEPRWQQAWDERGIFATGNDWRCVYFVERDNLPPRANLTPPVD